MEEKVFRVRKGADKLWYTREVNGGGKWFGGHKTKKAAVAMVEDYYRYWAEADLWWRNGKRGGKV